MSGQQGITAGQLAQEGLAIAETAAPLLPPGVQLAIGLIAAGSAALAQWKATGNDVPDETLYAMFGQFDKNKMDDLAAQAAAPG